MPSRERKEVYAAKFEGMLDVYKKAFIVGADYVGSNQLAQIRKALRPTNSEIMMGKNTQMRRIIRSRMGAEPDLERLLPLVKANIGLVFTNHDLCEVRDVIKANRVGAAAKAGVIAPISVVVPAGNTGLEPGQTSFLQALNIGTKITKGSIEIINDVHLITKGQKVGASESALLQKLNIKPFTYGLEIEVVYDNGNVFEPIVLDITNNDILKMFNNSVRNVIALCFSTGYTCEASIPFSVVKCIRNIIAFSVEANVDCDAAKKIKAYLADPSAFACSAPSGGSSGAGGGKAEAKAAVVEEEPEPEDEDMGMDLFGF